MKLTKSYFFAVLMISSLSLHAQMPTDLRFVESSKVVNVVQGDKVFKVTLRAGTQDPVTLLQGAQCREVEMGYHCYIKPVRVHGILITDVVFLREDDSRFEIKKIVLINGSFTATSTIGKNFTLGE